MKTLGIGFAGARYIARFHLESFNRLPTGVAEVRGVCSRSLEGAEAFAKPNGIPFATDSYDALLARDDIDVIDIVTPPNLHHDFAIRAAQAGKHVIMEKPLTGYFGEPGDPEPIGRHVSRAKMWEGARRNAEAVRAAFEKSGTFFGYAENWVYSPPIAKMRKLIAASKGSILDLRAEENHSGSSSATAREWRNTGGGALLRMGPHSLGAILHLKQWEGQVRRGKAIRPIAVVADTADLIHTEAVDRARQADAHKWIKADPSDVENWVNLVVHFDDGTRGSIIVSDVGLGGINNRVCAYMTDGVLKSNITMNDAVECYAPDPAVFKDEYFTMNLDTKAGWNRPSCDEEWFRGFAQEITDFIGAIRERRAPRSGIELAVDCVNVIYAGYVSAQEGRRVSLR